MQLGVLMTLDDRVEEEFRKIAELGIPTCQVNCWDSGLFTDEMANRVRAASAAHQVTVTHFWCGWEGPQVWDFIDGPHTLGLVPEAYRFERLRMLLRGAEFAGKMGVTRMISHVGFIPENAGDSAYRPLIAVLRNLIQRCGDLGVEFLFETGQETPVTLLRTIEDIGLPNVGINLDPANLIMYGKANPVDALDVIGPYVKGVHGKDGLYPTGGRALGEEVPLGEGKVDYPRFIAGLQSIGYTGAITTEREISGEQQTSDIISAKRLLESLLA